MSADQAMETSWVTKGTPALLPALGCLSITRLRCLPQISLVLSGLVLE